MRIIVSTLALVAFAAACAQAGHAPAPSPSPTSARGGSDALSGLRYLVGTWACTYNAAKLHVRYKATFAYDLDNNWMREDDSWSKGGDVAMFTHSPKGHSWTAVVADSERTAAVFRAEGSNPNHIVYHSLVPDASMSEAFDRTSPSQYVVHFTQHARGKTVRSTDVCTKA